MILYTFLARESVVRLFAAGLMLACYFVLGMFLDAFAIVFITMPLFVLIFESMGFDTIWFAVLFIVSMQSACLTPPFGYNLFYMRSVVLPEITIYDLYKETVPFILLQIVDLGLLLAFPQIAALAAGAVARTLMCYLNAAGPH